MRIYIFADLEGISGVVSSDYVSATGSKYATGCRLMAMDVNSCIKGCFDAGADSVIVRDGHSSGLNLNYEDIDPRATVIQGRAAPGVRYPAFDGVDGMILLGYHAMAGTENAVLEHTYSSKEIQNMWLNGKKAGELAFDAAIAAEKGVPTIMVSGDDKVCAEARDWLPDVVTCQVKESMTQQGCIMPSLDQCQKIVCEKTKEAVSSMNKIKPIIYSPATVRVEKVERLAPSSGEGITRIDGRTSEATSDSIEDAFWKVV